jgi:hypothetical protein
MNDSVTSEGIRYLDQQGAVDRISYPADARIAQVLVEPGSCHAIDFLEEFPVEWQRGQRFYPCLD